MNAPDPARVAAVHRDLLARWRVAMDLVGPGPLEPHFLDAEGAVAGLPVRGTWADLGSGAGFPGVALAAAHPDATVLLVESRQKRAIFLEQLVAEAGLTNARVHRVRAETLAPGLDGVIARAFLPPPQYLALAARLLAPDGLAVLLLGDRDPEPLPGWEVTEIARYPVPDGWRRRAVLRRLP